jgi:chorismate mutase/prephenate dehydratase
MELKKIRNELDKIDINILELLNKYGKLVYQVKKIKKNHIARECYVPEREQEIFKKLIKKNKGPFTNEQIKHIFSEIISASRQLQQQIRVAYWGPEGSFTHLASLQHFGSSTLYNTVKSIPDIFADVESERSHYGVIPIENSTEGVINHTLDMFVDSDLKICGEILLKVSHNLLSKTRDIKQIKKIYTGIQPLAQSKNWIETNMPDVKIIEVSTSAAASRLASMDRKSAAIASSIAAKIYNLNILAKSIEDIPDNYTRFFIIGKKYVQKTGVDKTSILLSVKDAVGALYTMLLPFKKYKINLTSIESRPSRKKAWDYYFFIDIEGHIENKNVIAAINELRPECSFVKVLGSYPAAIQDDKK